MTTALTLEQANAVFDVLVEDAGAKEAMRDEFVHYVRQDIKYGHEFRFMGSLGFGGKFLNNAGWKITCYPEHRTPERDATIQRTTARLQELKAREWADTKGNE